MTNMFWNKFNNDMRGYGEPTNNYNQNSNHQVSNNSNSYNSWSNNWNEPKQQLDNWGGWNYFNNELKQEKKPAKNFSMDEFMKTNFYNGDDMRVDGKKSNKFDMDGTINTNFLQTTYSVKQEGLHTTANGTHWKNGSENGKVKTRVHNNAIQAFDDEYGWSDIYAVNINMVKQMGNGKAAVYNSKMHGTVADVYHEDGSVTQGIFLDACGIAGSKSVIDKWVYNQEKDNETVSFKVKRQGWDKNNF